MLARSRIPPRKFCEKILDPYLRFLPYSECGSSASHVMFRRARSERRQRARSRWLSLVRRRDVRWANWIAIVAVVIAAVLMILAMFK